jgi:hypothetical protein
MSSGGAPHPTRRPAHPHLLRRRELCEVGRVLNELLDLVDRLSALVGDAPGRPMQRLDAVRDQVLLLALDVGLPVRQREDKRSEPATSSSSSSPST